ncbi:MAG: acyltransferase [Bacteroidales bacterium]|nr:acyltransferase [Bacteroidales bacterium]MCF8391524.1 acyltransferase [Bacteroidales bacterium]
MNIKETIKKSIRLKKLAIWALSPSGQARPRLWVKWFIIPFHSKKGKGATIRRNTRMDVLPFYNFYMGKRSTIEDFCTINNGVGKIQIGNNTRIGIGSVLIGPVNIGDDVRLAQNVVVSGLNHNYQDISKPISAQGVSVEEVFIGDETWIGANSVILPGVFIGMHCVIAAGSIVTKSIPSYSVVAGNPARIIKQYSKITGKWEKFVN